jgi:hypothetical protein
VVLVGEAGLEFREDGQFCDADCKTSPVAWTSILEAGAGVGVTACPVDSAGSACREPQSFPASEWYCVLRSGDPVLGVHIPAIGPLDTARCNESFRAAPEFFFDHFPEQPFAAFTCASWLLDPQLSGLLPPTSNVAGFQKRWVFHPVPGANPAQTIERIFGASRWDEARHMPRTTSLQKIVAGHLEAGGNLRMGGGVCFPEDFPA